ncbi:hypothetical protein ACIA5G_36975 [Amycolatopsis sp. NPDC051758]|uniref:hypothetical protein n=1 Tax=Amycolatopsis sp. NPDC051758 TaxID=3363935 RepID=UPI003796E837
MNTKVIGVVALALTLSGCGLKDGIEENGNGHVKNAAFTTGAEGKKDADTRLPSWVPDEAKSVTEAIRTTGSERILRFTTADVPATCTPAAAAKTAATLTASWWPGGTEGRTDRVCGDGWHVLKASDAVYAFKPETLDQTRA